MDEAARWGLKRALRHQVEDRHTSVVGMDEAARWGLKPSLQTTWVVGLGGGWNG